MVVTQSQTTILYWKYQSGADFLGYSCCVKTYEHDVFQKWMEKNCPKTEVIYKFNSGDPIYTVYIPDEVEALLFKLKWS